MFKSTIFFPTRNRPKILDGALKNILEFCPNSFVFVGNCSTKENIGKTSKIISKYENVKEFVYSPDPGTAYVYNELFQNIKTKYAIVWADDMLFLKGIEKLEKELDDPVINLVALPMIDDISRATSIKYGWPVDKYGCAFWNTPTGRCAHHSIVRTLYYQRWNDVYSEKEYIDNFFHNHSLQVMRIWPEDGAYCLHTRIDDDTRANMMIKEGVFRLSTGERDE